jgi:hypothetical protein
MASYIKLFREIQKHWLYEEKRKFSRYEAWIDLLMMVNHTEGKTMQDGVLVEVKRGERITSIRKLMDRWEWSNTKVVKFLELLSEDEMISFKTTPQKKTVIKILNYEKWQGFDGQDQPEKKTQKRQSNDSEQSQKRQSNDSEETQKNLNNKNKEELKTKKNEKEDKKLKYADFVKLTKPEYEKLVSEHGESNTIEMIRVLDNYKGASGKKYASDYRAILNWVVDRVKGTTPKQKELPKQQENKNEENNAWYQSLINGG